MANQQQVLSHLRSILKEADLETVTEETLKGQLTSHFSEDMSQHEDAIMVQIPLTVASNGLYVLGRFFGLFTAPGIVQGCFMVQAEVERFITEQAQHEAKSRKREQENCEPQSGKQKQARTSTPASTQPGVFVLSPDGLQRCVVKEFKGQKYVDVRMYWKVCCSADTCLCLVLNPCQCPVCPQRFHSATSVEIPSIVAPAGVSLMQHKALRAEGRGREPDKEGADDEPSRVGHLGGSPPKPPGSTSQQGNVVYCQHVRCQKSHDLREGEPVRGYQGVVQH